jgi:hypothetical protein
MKRVWLSNKFSYIYEASPSSNLVVFMQSLYSHSIGSALFYDIYVNFKKFLLSIVFVVSLHQGNSHLLLCRLHDK